MENNKPSTNVNIPVPAKIHRACKKLAAARGISLREYIVATLAISVAKVK